MTPSAPLRRCPSTALVLPLLGALTLGGCTPAPRVAASPLLVSTAPADTIACALPPPEPSGRQNLGPCVNSPYADIAPRIAPDGRTLYFDRKNDPANVGGATDTDDIWYSTLRANGTWGPARNLGAPLNNRGRNFVAAVLPGGTALLLGNTYAGDSTGSGASLSVRTSAGGWSMPEPLRIRGFQNRSEYASYYLSQDGRALLMAVEAPGGFGDQDLYVSFLQPDSSWGEPKNLGATINTTDDEDSPFLASDGVSLYFSSGGHGGYGDNDILVSRRLDESWTRWSPPENLGPAINTAGFDAGFVIPASGEYAYFTSALGARGPADLFRAPLQEALRPRPVALVRGRLLATAPDSARQAPAAGTVVYEALGDTTRRGAVRGDPTTGEYQVVLPTGDRYEFRGQVERAFPRADTIDLRGTTTYQERTRDVRVIPLEVGTTLRLENLLFDFGQATLRPESRRALDQLAKFLLRNPSLRVEIGGHTDAVGSDQANRLLSRRRARAVARYLNAKGVPRRRALPYGYGETRPAAPNDTEEGRRLNRRVELKVLAI